MWAKSVTSLKMAYMNQILACCSQVSLKAGCCCSSQISLFKNNRSSCQEVDCCFTCLAYGKAKAFSWLVFFCVKNVMTSEYGCSYSVKSRVRRQKARSENGYLMKQQLKGFQQWKWLRIKHVNFICINLVVILYARICRVSSLNKQILEDIHHIITFSHFLHQPNFRTFFEHA